MARCLRHEVYSIVDISRVVFVLGLVFEDVADFDAVVIQYPTGGVAVAGDGFAQSNLGLEPLYLRCQ